jgi:hypothetical protein
MKRGTLIVLLRNWASFLKGDRFKVAEIVDGGGPNNMKNVRCVLEQVSDDKIDDIFHRRTLPMEYVAEVPRVGSSTTVYANQGNRDGTILATLGTEVLLEYEMPAGKVFLRIEDLAGGHRSISERALPKKWRKELEA